MKPGVIWHLSVIKVRPTAPEHSRELHVQLLHLRRIDHSFQYGLPFGVGVVSGSLLSDRLKPLDPVVGVILLGLPFLRRGLAEFLADRSQAEPLVGVERDSYFFCEPQYP